MSDTATTTTIPATSWSSFIKMIAPALSKADEDTTFTSSCIDDCSTADESLTTASESLTAMDLDDVTSVDKTETGCTIQEVDDEMIQVFDIKPPTEDPPPSPPPPCVSPAVSPPPSDPSDITATATTITTTPLCA